MSIPNHLKVVELFWNIMVPSILAIVIAQLGKVILFLLFPLFEIVYTARMLLN